MRTHVATFSRPVLQRAKRRGIGRLVVVPRRRRRTLVLIDVPSIRDAAVSAARPGRYAATAVGTAHGRDHTRAALRHVARATRRTRRVGLTRAQHDPAVGWELRRARRDIARAGRPADDRRRRILVAVAGAVVAGAGVRAVAGLRADAAGREGFDVPAEATTA